MRIKASQIEALAKHIVRFLEAKKVVTFQKSPEELIALVTGIFQKNMEEEQKLNDEAKKLLDLNKKKIGQNIDEERAFVLIKKQLAKERNFVL